MSYASNLPPDCTAAMLHAHLGDYGDCHGFGCGVALRDDTEAHICEDCGERFCADCIGERDTCAGTEEVCFACLAKQQENRSAA